ncbi:helix-turn-helix domain-containing protein [Micromonospora polyrhachis]|uniref:helix-turn-helix domain-containing protein n=1 Tax=Micromonospora polyrhachis TaxID=1282883 RepID=UPI001C8798D2|nr:helix-turn-helix domain-containing protein [Micromonospora polyrhachis]
MSADGGRTIVSFGNALKDLRSSHGLSLRALAQRAHYSRSYLHELETGRKPPTHDVAERLDRVLDAGGRLVAHLSAPIQRLPDWADERVGAVSTGRCRPDPTVVDQLGQALAVQRSLEDSVGARAVLLPVLGQISTVQAVRGNADGPLHDELLSLESQYAQFAGWLYQDQADRSAMAQWYARALSQATEACDPSMVASILSMRSNAAWSAGDHRRAVTLAEASCRQPATPGTLALSQQQLARGLAAAGERDASLRALDEAEHLLDQARRQPDREPAWIYFHDPVRLQMQRALCLREAGDHQAAIGLVEAGLRDLPASYTRDRGSYLARLAVTYALSGERDGARATAAQARVLAEATGSTRTLAEIALAVRLADPVA